MKSSTTAAWTLAATRENRFWVLPPEGDPWREAARLRNRSIDEASNPTLGGPLAGEDPEPS